MRNPELMYLQDVLGIEGYIRPSFQASAEASETIVAFSDVPLVNGRQELLKKMLSSINVHEFLAFDCEHADRTKLQNVRPKAIVFLGEKTSDIVETWSDIFAEGVSLEQTIRTTLPSLEDLTDTSNPARLQALKKEAWARLQSFQREI